MNISEIAVINLSKYLYPYPPSKHTLNWTFWSFIASKVKSVDLIVCGNNKQTKVYREDNISVIYIPFMKRGFPGIIRYLLSATIEGLSLMKKRSNVLVWASDDIWGNFVGTYLSSRFNVPYLLELQGNVFSPPDESTRGLHKLIQNIAVSRGTLRATKIRLCCNGHLSRLLKINNALPGKVVRTRVDASKFAPDATLRNELRKKIGLVESQIIFITVASLVPGKGIHVFLDAFNEIVEDLPTAQYWIIGDGYYKGELLKKAESISEKVRFWGRLPQNEVKNMLLISDVFVLPTFAEGMPRAVHEAQAMQLPVIASAVDGLLEQITDGYNGKLIQAGDVSGFVAAAKGMRDPQVRSNMGMAGRENVLLKFNQPIVFEEWRTMLEECVNLNS